MELLCRDEFSCSIELDWKVISLEPFSSKETLSF
jgi:hypothetical protein